MRKRLGLVSILLLLIVGLSNLSDAKVNLSTSASDVPPEFREMIRELSLHIDKTELVDIKDTHGRQLNACQKVALSKAKQILDTDFATAYSLSVGEGFVTALEQLLPWVGPITDVKDLYNAYINSNSVSEFISNLSGKAAGKAVEALIGKTAENMLTDEGAEKVSKFYGKAAEKVYKDIGDKLKGLQDESYYGESNICNSKGENSIQALWTKKTGDIDIFVQGDCECKNEYYNTLGYVALKDWVVHLEGKASLVNGPDGPEWSVKFTRIRVRANCCDENGTPKESRAMNDVVIGTPMPEPPVTTPPEPPRTTPPSEQPPPPLVTTPPVPNPEIEKVKRLQDHADRMEAIMTDCSKIEAQIADTQAKIAANAQAQSSAKDQIAKAQTDLDNFTAAHTIYIYEYTDPNTGEVKLMQSGVIAKNAPASWSYKGTQFDPKFQKQREAKQNNIDALNQSLTALQQNADALNATLQALLKALEQCHDNGEAVRQECTQTSGHFRTFLQDPSNQTLAPGATDALKKYDGEASALDKLKERMGTQKPSFPVTTVPDSVKVTWTGIDVNRVQADVENTGDQSIPYVIQPGTILIPNNPRVQKMMIVLRLRMLLAPHSTTRRQARAVCLEMPKEEPWGSTVFSAGAPADGPLQKLADLTARAGFVGDHDQARIWIFTDKASLQKINDRVLPPLQPYEYLSALYDLETKAGVDLSASGYRDLLNPSLLQGVPATDPAAQWLNEKLSQLHSK